MRKSLFIISIVMAAVFVCAGLYAGTEVEDVIPMKADYEHTKGIVQFSHKKHMEDYDIGCGECHHNDKGEPRTELKLGDEVKSCFECHSKPGEIKGREAKGLSDEEKREYHANALHDNCRDCHRAYNRKNKTRAAPTSCSKCHPKE